MPEKPIDAKNSVGRRLLQRESGVILVNRARLCYVFEMEPQVFEGTVREIRTRLAAMPDDERVRVIVGRPSLTVMARRLQAMAVANGIPPVTQEEDHNGY